MLGCNNADTYPWENLIYRLTEEGKVERVIMWQLCAIYLMYYANTAPPSSSPTPTPTPSPSPTPTPTPTPTSPTCNDGQVRLNPRLNGYDGNGKLCLKEIFSFCYNNTFSPICDQAWDNNDAQVACRSLGYYYPGEKCYTFFNVVCLYSRETLHSTGATAYTMSYFGTMDEAVVTDFTCFGTESLLSDCLYGFVSEDDPCYSSAGVRCLQC